MLPTLRDVLALPAVLAGRPVVRAGEAGLDATVRWVHVAEISDIAGLLEGGELILTTGIALPRSGESLRRYVEGLVSVGVCGVVVELGRRYREALPAALVAAAGAAGLPLIELHRETPFVAVTQAVHTAILDARMRQLAASDDRERHRTLLTELALTAEVQADLGDRAEALGVPLRGRTLTGVAVRTTGAAAPTALLRDLAMRLADTLRAVQVPALVGLLDDLHVAVLLSQPDPRRVDGVLQRLCDQAHALGRRDGVTFVVGVGASATGLETASTSVRDAVRVALAAVNLAPRGGWYRAADLRLRGLVHELRDDPRLREFAERELAGVLADRQADSLLEVLDAYCRSGGNKSAAAAGLYVSRASLYDRLAKLERVLGVDLADADVVLGLHFALLVRQAVEQPAASVRAQGT